jgi:WD40 repeat protein
MTQRISLAILLLVCAAVARAADEAPLPPGDAKPVLQLEAGGPTAAVTAMVFSGDGKTLYVGGLDKVVRVWEVEAENKGAWALKRSFRVPIGPGVSGAINALALSPDGRWLAVGGRSVMRGESEFKQPGLVVPTKALSETMWLDSGTIHVFDLKNPAAGKVLRGHKGEVRALAFGPERDGKPPLLVSAAMERDGETPYASVRLWDAAKGGDALAVQKLPSKPLEKDRPALAVWHTGDGNTQVRAAVVWPSFELSDKVKLDDIKDEQGHVYLWDAAAKGDAALQRWKTGPGNSTVALLGFTNDEPRVVTGSISKFGDNTMTGGLRVWRFSRDADTKGTVEREAPFVLDRVRYWPWALAPVSTKGDGGFDRVAAVLQPASDSPDLVLTLTNLADPPSSLALKNTDRIHVPVIASAPRGKWLAVAGFKDRAVEIYAVDNLRAGPAARLVNKGIHYRKAVFVRRDKETGLWLSEDADAKTLQGGTFFSFDKRALAADAKGWETDAPDRAGLKPVFTKDDKTQRFTARIGDYPKVTLEEGQEPTWYALRPPTKERKQGLFAVAHTNRSSAETYVTLFDLATGKPLRQFTGHLQDVRWLEFSDTHPLLVSAADDQTVSVWSFADLGAGVAMIQGLVVGERDSKVVVLSAEPGSEAAKAGLKKDDVIEGFVEDGKVRAVKSAVDFYWTVNLKKPGDEIAVKAAGREAVRVKTGQGVEERKPLLSLFVTRDRREWIGWTPGGPFDRSGDAAEALIGWHTNTGKPEEPVTFAAAKEYKGEFYKRDILKHLIAEGSLPEALKKLDEPPPPPPQLTPDVEGARREVEPSDLFHVRERAVKLTARLNAPYPLAPDDVVQWQATGPGDAKLPPKPMKRVGDREWEADLSGLPWKRGEYRVEIQYRSDKHDKKASAPLTLRYQPPAPQLAGVVEKQAVTPGGETVVTVAEPKVAVAVTVTPADGEPAEVRFTRRGAKDMPKPRPVTKADSFTQEFALDEGVNHLEIVAFNKNALDDSDPNERSVLRVEVRYQKPQKQPAPRIGALRLTPPHRESFTDGDGNEVLVVDRPKVEVESAIQAENPLTLAEWSAGGETVKLPLDPQSPNKLAVRRTVELKPGKTTMLQVRAATKTSDPADATLWVVYRPLLPRVTIGLPREGATVFASKTTLGGGFVLPPTSEKYEFEVRVVGQGKEKKPVKAQVDEKGELWTTEVPLAPGKNTVEATVRSEWRPPVTVSVDIEYRRPPLIERVGEIKIGDKPFVDIAARVWSPANVPPLTVLIDNVEKPAKITEGDKVNEDGLKLWIIEVKGVPVKVGEKWLKSLVLNVRNADGLSRAPATIDLKPPDKPPPAVPPKVTLKIPDQDTTQQAKYHVKFVVTSESPLKSVEVWRGDRSVHKSDLKDVPKVGKQYEWQEEVDVDLGWEANRLHVTAVNDGGTGRSAEAVVTVLRPPVRVVVERIDVLGEKGDVVKTLEPVEQTKERVRFDVPQRAFVFLTGRVEWPDGRSGQLDDQLLKVVVNVNDSQQFPVALEARQPRTNRRTFRVPFVLTQKEKNRIDIKLPNLKEVVDSPREFTLDCAKPETRQRLHVLIVGVDVKDGEALKRRLLSEMGKDLPSGLQGEFTASPVFEKARLAAVLCGNVRKEAILGQLSAIERQIRTVQEQTKLMNDVVLIYYQGGEGVDERGNRYLKTTLNEKFPDQPLELAALAYSDIPRIPGVQVMLLNVTPGKSGAVASKTDVVPGDEHVGMICYKWQSQSGSFFDYFDKALKEAHTVGAIEKQVTAAVKNDKNALPGEETVRVPPGVAARFLSMPK